MKLPNFESSCLHTITHFIDVTVAGILNTLEVEQVVLGLDITKLSNKTDLLENGIS